MCKKSSCIFDIRTSSGSYFPTHEKRAISKVPKVTYIEDSKLPDIEETNEIDIVVEEELVFKSLQKDSLQKQMPLGKILQCTSCENIELAAQEKTIIELFSGGKT